MAELKPKCSARLVIRRLQRKRVYLAGGGGGVGPQGEGMRLAVDKPADALANRAHRPYRHPNRYQRFHVVASSEVLPVTRARPAGVHLGQEKIAFFQEPYLYRKKGAPTILSGCRLFPPGRPLLTMMGCRLFPPAADYCRLFPETRFLHTRVGADYLSPFRSYIILYVNGDGGGRVRTPHCTGAPVPNGWQVSLVWLYFGPV